jgi:hypothetical protein
LQIEAQDQATPAVLENTRLLGHYGEFKTQSQDECIGKCDADFKCAAACFAYPAQCRLFKFGFEQINEISGSTAYIKPEVAAELASIDTLGDKYPTIKQNVKLANFMDHFDSLTPSQCFKQCKVSRSCGAASFTTETKWLHNCYFYSPGAFKESTNPDGAEFWTSYVKPKTGSQPIVTATRRPFTQTATSIVTRKTTDAAAYNPSNSVDRSDSVQQATRLIGNVYAKHVTYNEVQCFDKCDADVKCAAASLTSSDCNLHKFGFTQRTRDSSAWIAYIKPEVSRDLADSGKLSDMFPPGVRKSTKLVNFYDSLDSLTPSRCFAKCKENDECAAASFTTDINSLHNCYLFKAGEFTESEGDELIESWTTYCKSADQPTATFTPPFSFTTKQTRTPTRATTETSSSITDGKLFILK